MSRRYVSGTSAIQLDNDYANYQNKKKRNIAKKTPIIYEKSNPLYTFILLLVIIVTLGITVILLKTQFTVSDTGERIIKLQNDLLEIKQKNSQLKGEIQKNTKIDEIYEKATKELGMIQATRESIEYIEPNEISYTVQYADLKQQKERSTMSISNLLAFITKGW